MKTNKLTVLVASLCAVAINACGSSDEGDGTTNLCAPNAVVPCNGCADGSGQAVCSADGQSYGSCQCASGAPMNPDMTPIGPVTTTEPPVNMPPTMGTSTPPTGMEPPPTGMEPPPTGMEPPPTGMEPPPTGMEPPPTGMEPPPTGMEPPTGVDPGIALDECNLDTMYVGDEFCILPPPTDEGFQIHYGPSDYDNPVEVARYAIAPGDETNIFTPPIRSANTTDVFYYKRQYRMRPGSHHLIVTGGGGQGGFAIGGRRLGGSQNTAKDNPTGPTPPENEGVGMRLAANSDITLNLHHFNATDQTIIRETWINFWYVPANEVTEQANEMFLFAPGTSVPPGGRTTYRGSKTINQPGRVLTMYGHRHSTTVRFSAYLNHGGQRELVYEDYDWEEPSVFEFNTLTQNPQPNAATGIAGAHNGVLELAPGDRLEWECEVENDNPYIVTYGANEAFDSEMCILIGDAVGPELTGFL